MKPEIKTPLPGPKAAELIARDARAMSPSFTRAYPFVMDHGRGCWVTDVDGNRFLDFTAGIAVVTTGHSHPKVVAAIKDQADHFLHMSGTDFYYQSEIELAERLEDRILPGTPARVMSSWAIRNAATCSPKRMPRPRKNARPPCATR